MDWEKKNMLSEINRYFRTRVGDIGGFKNFSNSGLYEFYGNIFGPSVYTEETSLNFIGVDKNGTIYDEIYYPFESIEKAGTIIPKMFLEMDLKPIKPSPEWKQVAEKGYCLIKGIKPPDLLAKQALEEAFIPHGINPELNMSKSIYHAYFATLADYDQPESHKNPEYMNDITQYYVQRLPHGQSIIQNYLFHTADIVKYIYDKTDLDSIHGPYSFHMDYFARCMCMFFVYYAKTSPILGRELLVGQREDFADFSQEALDLSPAQQPVEASPFEKVSDDRITNFDSIPIDHGTVVLMNTLNPMFVHKVNKLKHQNEVILLTNYLWSPDWPKAE